MPTFFPLGCGSPLYSIAMTFRKSLILLLIFCWSISHRTPLCQVVIALSWAFPASLSLMLASLTWSIRHIVRACLMSSHIEPFYIYPLQLDSPFLSGGDFPSGVVFLHMFPCIDHRCVSLLGTSLFVPWHSSSPRFVTIKNFYSTVSPPHNPQDQRFTTSPHRDKPVMKYTSSTLVLSDIPSIWKVSGSRS